MPRRRGQIALLVGLLFPACSGVAPSTGESNRARATKGVSAELHFDDRASTKVDGVAEYGGGFALWNTSGSLELRGAGGARIKSLDSGVVGISEVARTWNGWLVRGSQLRDGAEFGTIALISDDGSVAMRWNTPGLFWSMTTVQNRRLASNHVGDLFSLENDGRPVQLGNAAVTGGAVQLRVWADALATCSTGSRRVRGNPEATCARPEGPSVHGKWRDAPIACGPWLVADTQATGANDSVWTRTVWSTKTAAQTAAKRIDGPSSGLRCSDGLLVDTTPPGRIYRLPNLDSRAGPLCDQAAVSHLGVAGRNVLCVGPDGDVRMHADAF